MNVFTVWQVPRKHCQSVPVKKPRIVAKKVPKKTCEYGGGGKHDGGGGYDAAHGHGGYAINSVSELSN